MFFGCAVIRNCSPKGGQVGSWLRWGGEEAKETGNVSEGRMERGRAFSFSVFVCVYAHAVGLPKDHRSLRKEKVQNIQVFGYLCGLRPMMPMQSHCGSL